MRGRQLILIVALSSALTACNPQTGGGVTQDGTGASCPAGACGGDVVGTWNIESSCVTGAGLAAAMDFREPACDGAFSKVQTRTSGSITFAPDGTLTSSQSSVLDMDVVLTPACIQAISNGAGAANVCPALEQRFLQSMEFAAVACGVQAGACLCSLSTPEQRLDHSGTYRIEGVELVDQVRHPYCVEGDRMLYSTTANQVTSTLTLTRAP